MLATRFKNGKSIFKKQSQHDAWKEGWEEVMVKLFPIMLGTKFGPAPDWVNEKIATADTKIIETWAAKLLNANALDEVFA